MTDMSQQMMIGTIVLFPTTFPVPVGFLACNGQALPTNKYQALFTIIGTRYGGNIVAFNVPKLTPPPGTMYIMCIDGTYPERP